MLKNKIKKYVIHERGGQAESLMRDRQKRLWGGTMKHLILFLLFLGNIKLNKINNILRENFFPAFNFTMKLTLTN